MEKYLVRGGNRLYGEVPISGGKNAAVAILPATVLIRGACRIENVPDIRDVRMLLNILRRLGAEVSDLKDGTVVIDCSGVSTSVVEDREDVSKMRGSYYFMGALLGRFGKAKVGMPGGCDFGSRPIDQHIKGFEALGARVSMAFGEVLLESDGLKGASVYMDINSVGATINIMLAAVLAPGQTTIENAAKEPHIVDVANFLNSMGADIKGAGTDVIRIRGVEGLLGGEYTIIPDQIEAGTFMVAAAATGGRVTIRNIIPKHLDPITAKLKEAGVKVEEVEDSLIVCREGDLEAIRVKTLPYPGFPTDMQPQITTLLCTARGHSIVTESVYDHRFGYVTELMRMGANLSVAGKVCNIDGVGRLMGTRVRAHDLRAGVAMIIAALCAEGETEISDIEYVERGYENIVDKFRSLGADIVKVSVED